jgi:hypothetical protein
VANPNRSLGRIWKNFQKYWLFGPNFDKNCEKTLKISKNHLVSIQDWATEVSFLSGPQVCHTCSIKKVRKYEAMIKKTILKTTYFSGGFEPAPS